MDVAVANPSAGEAMTWDTIAGGFAALWAWATLCVATASTFKRWRLERTRTPSPAAAKGRIRALMIRPCAGSEADLQQCLMSFADAQRNDMIDLVLAVDNEEDSAWPIVQTVCSQLRDRGVAANALVVTRRGANRKAAIIAGVLAEHGHAYDLVINADSNVDLAGFDLGLLTGPFVEQRTLGALWAPPIEVSDGHGLGNQASEAVLSGSFHAFPLLCGVDPTGMVGKLFAVRASALRRVAGFCDLVDYLGEDFELSRRLVDAGYDVSPIKAVVQSRSGPKSFWDTVNRHARWMTVIRAQRPGHLLSYPLWFFPLPLILLLAIVAIWGSFPALGWLAVVVALLARLLVAVSARVFSGLDWSPHQALKDTLLADSVLALAWVKALASRRVLWRGQSLQIDGAGRVRPIESYR
jgi:ceramide glucosyltransferase